MPYTPEQLVAEVKAAFDKATEGLSPEQKAMVADEIGGWLGGFPPRKVVSVGPERASTNRPTAPKVTLE